MRQRKSVAALVPVLALACAMAGAIFGTSVMAADETPGTQPTVTYRPGETTAQRDARMKWWREARFGMFIHWGIYSVPAGIYKGKKINHIGEWIMNDAKIPVAEYAKYAKEFDPVKFNADRWVEIAKNAGMKYMVITSKHHDGFAMFHTHVDHYNVYDATPWHHDPIAELSKAAAAHGLKFGLYYSQCQDWHHPGGAALHGGHWDPAQDGDYDAYLRNVALPQVKEILNNYGPIAELWWDTPVDMTPARYAPFVEEVNKHPNLIMNDRLAKKGSDIGDFSTPEQYIPATGIPGKDWETCMTMNDTWGYKSWDNDWKSSETLIHNLIDAASKGGNYLLNVGPNDKGEIPEASIERLADIGKWMKVNGEAIYATTASPFRLQPWGRCTKKVEGDKTILYLHVFEWPKNGELNVPVSNKVLKTYLLADRGTEFKTTVSPEDGTTVHLTGSAPDKVASVVVMEVQGSPEVVEQVVRADGEGALHLNAFDADLSGSVRLADVGGYGKVPARLYNWKAGAAAKWQVSLPAGTYEVFADESSSAEMPLTLSAGDQTVDLKLPSSGAEKKDFKFENQPVGELHVAADGKQTVTLTAPKSDAQAALSVHEIVLKPKQ